MVLLGMRPKGMTRAFSALGRETFITPVTWEDGWPVAEPVILNPRAGGGEFRMTSAVTLSRRRARRRLDRRPALPGAFASTTGARAASRSPPTEQPG